MLTSTLQLLFANAAGRQVTVSLLDPQPTLTGAAVQAAMQTIIDRNVFTSAGGALAGINGARIVNREVTDIDMP
ncbi:MAG: DUF2922 domain-containing protein [Clostridia bacterium]|nr:MAG: DUF2922 domain-containing protein [Clostridia bacterium]